MDEIQFSRNVTGTITVIRTKDDSILKTVEAAGSDCAALLADWLAGSSFKPHVPNTERIQEGI